MDAIAQLLATITDARQVRDAAREQLATDHAPAFNAIRLLSPGETSLSATFRWMLDERESHGQRRLFQLLFTEHFMKGSADLSGASVHCEVPTSDGLGRIDLLISDANARERVIVENKPWAMWQQSQLRRYVDDQRAPGRRLTVIAFIGGSGNAQAEVERHWVEHDSLPCPEFVKAFDFDAVADWIEASAAAARPEHVRWFLFDLADYCRDVRRGGGIEMTEVRQISDAIIADGPDAIRSAFEVETAMANIRASFVTSVAQRVRLLLGDDWSVTTTMWERFRSKPGLIFERKGQPGPFVICLFETDGGGSSWAGFRIGWELAAIATDLRSWRHDEYWVAWQHLSKLNDESSRTFVEALEQKDIDRVADAAAGIASHLLGSPRLC